MRLSLPILHNSILYRYSKRISPQLIAEYFSCTKTYGGILAIAEMRRGKRGRTGEAGVLKMVNTFSTAMLSN